MVLTKSHAVTLPTGSRGPIKYSIIVDSVSNSPSEGKRRVADCAADYILLQSSAAAYVCF